MGWCSGMISPQVGFMNTHSAQSTPGRLCWTFRESPTRRLMTQHSDSDYCHHPSSSPPVISHFTERKTCQKLRDLTNVIKWNNWAAEVQIPGVPESQLGTLRAPETALPLWALRAAFTASQGLGEKMEMGGEKGKGRREKEKKGQGGRGKKKRKGGKKEGKREKGKVSQKIFFDSSSTNIIKPEYSLGYVKRMNLKGVMMWLFFPGSEGSKCQQESFMGDIPSPTDAQNHQWPTALHLMATYLYLKPLSP